MTSLAQITGRLSRVERAANASSGRWFTACNGVIPDEYRPGIDSLISVRFADDPPLMWRGKPHTAERSITAKIGG